MPIPEISPKLGLFDEIPIEILKLLCLRSATCRGASHFPIEPLTALHEMIRKSFSPWQVAVLSIP